MVGKMKSQNPLEHSSRIPGRRKQICIQIVAGILIFFSGIIVGSGGTVLSVKDRIAWIRPPHGRSMVPDIVERFKSQYNLTEEQARQVKDVFQEGMQTRMSVYEEVSQKLEEHEKTLTAKMKQILSAEQYEQWVRDFKARKERFERFGRRGPRPERAGPERRGQRRFGPGRPDPNRPGPGKPGERGPGRRGFGERGPGPRRPGQREPVQGEPGSDSTELSEPNFTPE